MNFELNEEQRMIEQVVYEFARHEILPEFATRNASKKLSADLVPKMAEFGFMSVCLPVRYGGAGLDYISLAIVAKGLQWANSTVAQAMAAHLGMHALPIFQWGSERQKQAYLSQLSSGETIGTFAYSRSDVATFAEQNGDCVLTGSQQIFGLADKANQFLVVASSAENQPTAFIINRQTEGVSLTVNQSSTAYMLHLNQAVAADILGGVGDGAKIAHSAFVNGNYIAAAGAVGLMKHCLEAVINYVKGPNGPKRDSAYLPLAKQKISQIQQKIESAELLVYRAGWLKNCGMPSEQATSMAKLVATEAAYDVARITGQILGRDGLAGNIHVARHLEASKYATQVGGTTHDHELKQADFALGGLTEHHYPDGLPAFDAAEWRRHS